MRGVEPSTPTASTGLAPATLIQSLIGLRRRVLERLDELELLVNQRPASLPLAVEFESRNQVLERKQVALEEAENRLKAQAERQDREWAALLNQLEADRHLLAEAWERIEEERIGSTGSFGSQAPAHSHNHPLGQGFGLQRSAPTSLSDARTRVSVRSTSAESDSHHTAGQEILRQFQTLCSDVRRNAEDRREPPEKGRRPES